MSNMTDGTEPLLFLAKYLFERSFFSLQSIFLNALVC